MNIQEVKESIENKTIDDNPIIFVYDDNPFVAFQYINEISKIKGKHISYLETIEDIGKIHSDLFGVQKIDDGIRVFRTEEISSLDDSIRYEKNLYIIVHKLKLDGKSTIEKFKSIILKLPKLEDWCIKDFMYSLAPGVKKEYLDWLQSAANNDIYRIDNELAKLSLFSDKEQSIIFDEMLTDRSFVDISSFNVFNITNSVTSRDMVTLQSSLEEIKSFDAEPLGVVTLLYQAFKKIILVWLASNPTTESTGLKSNVIWAVKNQPRVYSKDQILNCFLLLTDIDKRLKTGEIEIPWLIDYVICKCLTY